MQSIRVKSPRDVALAMNAAEAVVRFADEGGFGALFTHVNGGAAADSGCCHRSCECVICELARALGIRRE